MHIKEYIAPSYIYDNANVTNSIDNLNDWDLMKNIIQKHFPPEIEKNTDGRFVLDSYTKVLDYILINSNDDEINLSDCVLIPSIGLVVFDISELFKCAQEHGKSELLGISQEENCINSFIIKKRVNCRNSIISNALFVNTTFEEWVGFEDSELSDIHFTHSIFQNSLSISDCQIAGYITGKGVSAKSIYLHGITYTGSSFDFIGAKIKSLSILSSSFKYSEKDIQEAERNPQILQTDFNLALSTLGNVHISSIYTELYMSFLDTQIKNAVHIYNSEFEKGLVFENSVIDGKQTIIQRLNSAGIKDNSSVNFRGCKINTDIVLDGISIDFIDATGCNIGKNGRLSIFYTDLNNINFVRASISGELNFSHINPKANKKALIDLSCTLNLGEIYISLENVKVANYDTAKILRLASQKLNNSIEISKLRALEHNLYLKENQLQLSFSSISDHILLLLNKYSNNFGTNWITGVIFCVIIASIFSGLVGLTMDEYTLCINPKYWAIFSNKFWMKTLEFLWLPNLDSFKELISAKNCNPLSVICYVIGKSLIAYGIFQTVAAFRKYCNR